MRMWTVKLFLLLNSFLLAVTLAYSQAPQQNRPDEIIKTCTELVVVDAHVLKRTGETVRGLNKEDFTLFEDGVEQRITHFSQDRLPMSIVLLMDISGSTMWELIQDRTLRTLDRLRPEDEIALMVFHTEAFLAQNFTKDRALILDRIMHPRYDYQSTVPPDGTHIADSIYQAAGQLNKAANPSSRRVMIVVTDNRPWEKWSRHSRKGVRNELFESGAVVYGVVTKGRPYLPGGGLVSFTEKWHGLLIERRNKGGTVNDYADPTGGIMIDARQGDPNTKLDQLVDLLRGRYSFGYRPANSTIDSRFRRTKVKVTRQVEKREGKPVVLSRKGYLRSGCEIKQTNP